MPDVAAVVVAAGRGTRVAGDAVPKQFRRIGGETMLRRTLVTLVEAAKLARVQPVIHPDDVAQFRSVVSGLDVLPPVFGGATRQVASGLTAVFYPAASEAVIYVMMAVVLLLRPRGLFGEEGMMS